MPTIALEALGFHYESPYTPVFGAVDLRIDTLWRTALVGRNGHGKTTLLRLVLGLLEPRQGRLHVPVETVPFLPPRPGSPEPTRTFVRESVAPFRSVEARMQALLDRGDDAAIERYGALALEYERLGGYTIDHRIEQEWGAMGLDTALLDRPHATLSGGERTRAAIVALFLREGGYPVIDEPSDHLDRDGRDRVAAYLAAKPGFLLVSHDRALLDRSCDHVVAIERGRLRLHGGDYSGLRVLQAEEEAHEARARQRLGREIGELERAARDRRDWSAARERTKRGAADKGFVGARAARTMKRALHAERRAHAKLEARRALVRVPDKSRRLVLARASDEEPLVVAEHVRVAAGGRILVDDLDLVVRRGERIAITGPNGCGKSLLLDTLAAERAPDAGRITPGRHIVVCRSRQTPRWQSGRLAEHLRGDGIDETAFRNVLGALGLEGDSFDRPLETFSEGERKKVELCASFLRPADLWIWDEPLNHLDIECREQIEETVLRDAPTLLFAEHDARFAEAVATREIRLGT